MQATRLRRLCLAQEHPEHALLPRQIAVELHMFPPEHVKSMVVRCRVGVLYRTVHANTHTDADAYAHFITETGTFQPPGTPSDMVAHNGLDYLHPMIRLFQKFDAAGYQVAASEYNPVSIAECCQEFVLVRA